MMNDLLKTGMTDLEDRWAGGFDGDSDSGRQILVWLMAHRLARPLKVMPPDPAGSYRRASFSFSSASCCGISDPDVPDRD